jgi:hypothetical protein
LPVVDEIEQPADAAKVHQGKSGFHWGARVTGAGEAFEGDGGGGFRDSGDCSAC